MKVNGSSWKFALIFLIGIIIAAQLLFIIHWRWQFWQNKHWKGELPSNWVAIEVPYAVNQTNSLKGPTLAIVNGTSALLPKQIVQELICPRNQKVQSGCYVVLDGPTLTGSGFSRFLVMEPTGQLTLTEAALKFPLREFLTLARDGLDFRLIDYNFTRENARQWPIETTKVPMSYQKIVVAQPFLTQTFAPSLDPSKVPDGKKRRILSLGLHGSTVNNFFANLSTKYDVTVVEPEPALRYIAEKWFGFEPSEHHRIFIENPAFYVMARARIIENSDTVKVPKHFDYIVVDVCYGLGVGAKTSPLENCPINEFEDEKVVDSLAKNLAINGTIVLHFSTQMNKTDLAKKHQLANHEHQMMQLFKKYFNNCYFLSAPPADLILTCTRRQPMTRANYILAFRKLPKEFQQFPKNEEPKFFLDLEAV